MYLAPKVASKHIPKVERNGCKQRSNLIVSEILHDLTVYFLLLLQNISALLNFRKSFSLSLYYAFTLISVASTKQELKTRQYLIFTPVTSKTTSLSPHNIGSQPFFPLFMLLPSKLTWSS
jgi:hypothetical protein